MSDYPSRDPERVRQYNREYRQENLERIRAKDRDWKARNPDKTRAHSQKYRETHRDCHRNHYLLKTYGITLEQYDGLLAAQGGRCALFEVCGNSEPGGHGTWHIDHDHETGQIRGLLCHSCNSSRVAANDIKSARAVVTYLERATASVLFVPRPASQVG